MKPSSSSTALVGVVVCILATACAGVDPVQLKPADPSQVLVLRSQLEYSDYFSISGNKFIYRLAQGRYAARYDDGAGTYYEGQDKCLEVQVVSDGLAAKNLPQSEPTTFRCGIYVSRRTQELPKVYLYRNAEQTLAASGPPNLTVQTTGSPGAIVAGGGVAAGLITALDAAEFKNIHFARSQPPDDRLRRAISQ